MPQTRPRRLSHGLQPRDAQLPCRGLTRSLLLFALSGLADAVSRRRNATDWMAQPLPREEAATRHADTHAKRSHGNRSHSERLSQATTRAVRHPSLPSSSNVTTTATTRRIPNRPDAASRATPSTAAAALSSLSTAVSHGGDDRTLVALIGQLRGGQHACASLLRHVVDANRADLVVLMAAVDNAAGGARARGASSHAPPHGFDGCLARAKHVWLVHEPDDWSEPMERIAARLGASHAWRGVANQTAYVGFLGPARVRDGLRAPSTGGINLVYRHLLKQVCIGRLQCHTISRRRSPPACVFAHHLLCPCPPCPSRSYSIYLGCCSGTADSSSRVLTTCTAAHTTF